jgi:serine/threonine protein kinase
MSDKRSKVKLEDFNIVRLIGVGSYGKVYAASKKSSNKIYAIKILKKEEINNINKKKEIKTERILLAKLNHPFIMKLDYAFQTRKSLYFITKFMHGGELNYHIYNDKKNYFSEEKAKFYAAEIILGLNYLHQNCCIYRDLKPENVLIDLDGHIKLTDFGLSKLCEESPCKARTMCGTPEYLAPEMLFSKDYGIEVDWWSLGILIYEMISGYLPFKILPDEKVTKKVYKKKFKIFSHFSNEVKDLLKKLLEFNPKKRIGYDKIIAHPFFKDIDWERVEKKEMIPPFIPNIEDNDNFFRYFEDENELKEEFNSHIKKNKMFYKSENMEIYKDNFLYDEDEEDDNNFVLNNLDEGNYEESYMSDKYLNAKYLFNAKNNNYKYNTNDTYNSDMNGNFNNSSGGLDSLYNYMASDLNKQKRKRNKVNKDLETLTRRNNYFPGFSFSSSDEE